MFKLPVEGVPVGGLHMSEDSGHQMSTHFIRQLKLSEDVCGKKAGTSAVASEKFLEPTQPAIAD